MSAPANSALDDARKRARRRLLGAIVLALIAAVVVPLFLESDPKPLGPDVQIQIPPVDDGKFQNRLTTAQKGAESGVKPTDPAAKGDVPRGSADAGKATPLPAPPKDAATPKDAPSARDGGTAKDPGTAKDGSASVDGKADGASAADLRPADRKSEAADGAKSAHAKSDAADAAKVAADRKAVAAAEAKAGDTKPEQKADAKVGDRKANAASDDKRRPAPATAAVRAAEPTGTNLGTQTLNTAAPAPKSGPEYVVQLGAFVDKSLAMDLATRAGEQGFSVFLEPVTTKSGAVQRVRVGPFATRQAADEAAARLVKAGFTAVATAR